MIWVGAGMVSLALSQLVMAAVLSKKIEKLYEKMSGYPWKG